VGQDIQLTASDGHQFSAYLCEPEGAARGGVIVIQEIFGVNVHIRDITERFAALGYKAIAPAVYDRFERGFEVGYAAEDIALGRVHKASANENLDAVMADVEAARLAVADAGNVGITGFCWGGFVTWMAACRLDIKAAAGYYGGGILDYNSEHPQCPTILHFGERDTSIPLADVEQIKHAHADVEIYIYQADHGFHCDMRGAFDARAADIAGMRTLRLFDENLRR
jgi:carboxymethylenebutenolidase